MTDYHRVQLIAQSSSSLPWNWPGRHVYCSSPSILPWEELPELTSEVSIFEKPNKVLLHFYLLNIVGSIMLHKPSKHTVTDITHWHTRRRTYTHVHNNTDRQADKQCTYLHGARQLRRSNQHHGNGWQHLAGVPHTNHKTEQTNCDDTVSLSRPPDSSDTICDNSSYIASV